MMWKICEIVVYDFKESAVYRFVCILFDKKVNVLISGKKNDLHPAFKCLKVGVA